MSLLSPEMSLLSSDIVLKEVMVRQVKLQTPTFGSRDRHSNTIQIVFPVPTRVFAICMWHVLEKKVGVVQLLPTFFFNLNNFFYQTLKLIVYPERLAN